MKFFIHALTVITAMSLTVSAAAQNEDKEMDKFITKLMKGMSLEEKLGQLNLGAAGDPYVLTSNYGLEDAARRGLVGAVPGCDPALQKLAVEESPSGIPVLFGLDVIHGYNTTFPIPLAQACSWNIDMVRRGAQIAAREATANGICWTWSPMVDIARDPRWGRVAEGAGEDPYLGSRIAQAMVQGYQGTDMAADTTLLACFKHFGLYGAAEGGRDYGTCDMSKWMMYNYYLPPYKAAVDAGCGSGMSSFNVVDGIPASGNRWLLTDLLRGEWGFKGFLVSDANSIGEMETHGMGDAAKVAELGLNAGLDMDMGSQRYVRQAVRLLKEKRISMKTIDELVRNVLTIKYKLGLFEDPYRYCSQPSDPQRLACCLSDEHCAFARDFAAESIVLLENNGVLPLSSGAKVAVVGPIGDNPSELFGTWSTRPDGRKSHNVAASLSLAGLDVVSFKGCEDKIEYSDYYSETASPKNDSLIAEAVKGIADADVVIATVGETSSWSGEAHSRVDICIPPAQKQLLKALFETGKPVVVVVFSGRPLILTDESAHADALVEAWHGGTQAADALADVLTGKVNPSGRLSMTFPRFLGQIPIYYNHLNTGRPLGEFWATTKYVDISLEENYPLYPFGYGLSYNKCSFSAVKASKTEARGDNDSVTVSVDVKNEGSCAGKEVVQLYIRDLVGEVSRPVKELKGFQKVSLAPGETKTVSFTLTTKDLKYYNASLKYVWEPGEFDIFIGPNSRDCSGSVRINWTE